jgi:hypothetical protein
MLTDRKDKEDYMLLLREQAETDAHRKTEIAMMVFDRTGD